MSQEIDEVRTYRDNRYGFHTNAPISEKAGVSPEFVHAMHESVCDLQHKTEKARCLRSSGDPDYALAVEVLERCASGIQNGVENKISQQHTSEKENVEPVSSSYNFRGF